MTLEQFEEANQWCLDLVCSDPEGIAWDLSNAIENDGICEGSKLSELMLKFRREHGQAKLEVFLYFSFYPTAFGDITQSDVWKIFCSFCKDHT